jgi:hypothetical protein
MSIIKGYKGVIDLDLSLISKIHRKSAIEQHNKDIEEYKKYQLSLKLEHRYENTICRIKKNIDKATALRNKNIEIDQKRRYKLYVAREENKY